MKLDEAMRRVSEYITEKEEKDFCSNCNEICSRHCVVWRKAEMRHDETERKRRKMKNNKNTEATIFAKQTLEQGGEWFLLEQSEEGELYKSQGKWCDGRNYFNTPPVFQVFDSEGKRVFASESYINAYHFYQERLKKGD